MENNNLNPCLLGLHYLLPFPLKTALPLHFYLREQEMYIFFLLFHFLIQICFLCWSNFLPYFSKHWRIEPSGISSLLAIVLHDLSGL
uniref:Uncharacterized protein n=1 Tax=Rhizophora mucronata TaxID=61149 RepID=A0A2P2KBM3_RHIMU